MYKIFKNGTLYKITKYRKCVEAIVDRFLNNWIEGDSLTVEKDGKVISEYYHF